MLAFRNATLVDASGERDADLAIDGKEIAAVGDLSTNANQDLLLDGMYVAPGLLDTHVHLMLDARPGQNGSYTDREPYSRLAYRASDNLRTALANGVTAVRDLGGKKAVSIEAGRAVRQGTIQGPRVQACGEPIAITGGHAYHMATEVDGPAEAMKAARKQIKRGATVIKCMASGNMLVRDRQGPPELTREELSAIVPVASDKSGLHALCHP